MELTCPKCGARYRVAADAVGPDGRTIRCAHCGESWFEGPPALATGPEPGPEMVATAHEAERTEPSTMLMSDRPDAAPPAEEHAAAPAAYRSGLDLEAEDTPRGGPSAITWLLIALVLAAVAYVAYGVYAGTIALPG